MALEFRELNYIVTDEDKGLSIRSIMTDRLNLSSREISRCKRFEDGVMVLRAGDLEASGIYKQIFIREIPYPGDNLRIRIYEDVENAGEVVPSDIPIEIVYEDEDMILLNKPGDMVVHPSYAHYRDSLSNALQGYYQKTGQRHVIRTIGRLDRETSGLIVFAKNRHCAALLSAQKKDMSGRKKYIALAQGVFEKKTGTIDLPIDRVEGDRMLRHVTPEGKRAVTHYTVEKQFSDYALISLKLETGRTHQIRVHMAHIGHPLLGDSLYGDKESSFDIKRAALHAAHLEFVHPITGKELSFDVPLPNDMSLFC